MNCRCICIQVKSYDGKRVNHLYFGVLYFPRAHTFFTLHCRTTTSFFVFTLFCTVTYFQPKVPCPRHRFTKLHSHCTAFRAPLHCRQLLSRVTALQLVPFVRPKFFTCTSLLGFFHCVAVHFQVSVSLFII